MNKICDKPCNYLQIYSKFEFRLFVKINIMKYTYYSKVKVFNKSVKNL